MNNPCFLRLIQCVNIPTHYIQNSKLQSKMCCSSGFSFSSCLFCSVCSTLSFSCYFLHVNLYLFSHIYPHEQEPVVHMWRRCQQNLHLPDQSVKQCSPVLIQGACGQSAPTQHKGVPHLRRLPLHCGARGHSARHSPAPRLCKPTKVLL